MNVINVIMMDNPTLALESNRSSLSKISTGSDAGFKIALLSIEPYTKYTAY